MNILLIGKPFNNLINAIKSSNSAEKLFCTETDENNIIPNIAYSDIYDLMEKALALQVDIAINLNNELVLEGVCELFRQSRINLISVNKKWLNLEISRIVSKQLLEYYNINTPKIIKTPLKFPIIVKSDMPQFDYEVFSMNELVEVMKRCENTKTFMEEPLQGINFALLSLWDGANLYCFDNDENLTEVQVDRLSLLKTKLQFLLSDEKADFVGFFTINLLWAKNDWYVKEFKMGIDEKSAFSKTKTDFLYILNSAIYQTLNEI